MSAVATKDRTMGYYARRESCGHVHMAIVDRPETAKEVQEEIAKALRRGEAVNRSTIDAIKKMRWCNCGD